MIVHEGKSTKQGHYYAYIKNTADGKWYEYNDSIVKLVGTNLNSVKKYTSNAYILFYQKEFMDQGNCKGGKDVDITQHNAEG